MNTKIINFKMMRGDTTRIGISITGLDGMPDAITFSVKQSYGRKEYILQKTLNDGIIPETTESGLRYIIEILPEDTDRLASGNYVYDLEVIINSDVVTLLTGTINIQADVTRHLEVTG